MRRQHQQQPTPRTPATRRRPAWNSYLTDGAQYRLNERQQLTRQLQQLSTAHFSSRSPSANVTLHQRSTTPSRYSNNDVSSNGFSSTIDSERYAVNNTSVASASESTPAAMARERPGSSDSARRRKVGASVSFKLDHDDHSPDRSQKRTSSLYGWLHPTYVSCILTPVCEF